MTIQKLLERYREGGCMYCKKDATEGYLWAEGRGIIWACDSHQKKAKHQIEVVNKDEIVSTRTPEQQKQMNKKKKESFTVRVLHAIHDSIAKGNVDLSKNDKVPFPGSTSSLLHDPKALDPVRLYKNKGNSDRQNTEFHNKISDKNKKKKYNVNPNS